LECRLLKFAQITGWIAEFSVIASGHASGFSELAFEAGKVSESTLERPR
jgi:hypothetical protein